MESLLAWPRGDKEVSADGAREARERKPGQVRESRALSCTGPRPLQEDPGLYLNVFVTANVKPLSSSYDIGAPRCSFPLISCQDETRFPDASCVQ